MKFDLGEVIVSAWKIIWKHKVLWIFGVLAGCAGQGGNGNSSRSSNGNGSSNLGANEILRDMEVFLRDVVRWFMENQWAFFALIGFFVVLLFIQITLANIGHIGLVRGAYRADLGAEKIPFGELWRESLSYFWRVIGLSLAVWGPVYVVLIGMVAALILGISSSRPQYYGQEQQMLAALALFFLAFCCCMIPVMLLLGLFYSQAVCALTLEDLGVGGALQRGWQVFSANFVGLLVAWLVVTAIGVVAGIAIAIPGYVAIIPLVFKFMAGTVDTWTPVILTMLVLCAYSPVAMFLRGILLSYVQSVWTLIYVRVTELKNKKDDAPVVLLEAHA